MLRSKPNANNREQEFEWLGVLEVTCRTRGDGSANCEYLIMETQQGKHPNVSRIVINGDSHSVLKRLKKWQSIDYQKLRGNLYVVQQDTQYGLNE